MALAPMMTVIDMMINHMAHRIQPVEIRRTVMAKDVLLHKAAKMEKVPAALETKTSRGKMLGSGISHVCLPYPTLTAVDVKAQAIANETCQRG
jgi:hypothetical protein